MERPVRVRRVVRIAVRERPVVARMDDRMDVGDNFGLLFLVVLVDSSSFDSSFAIRADIDMVSTLRMCC